MADVMEDGHSRARQGEETSVREPGAEEREDQGGVGAKVSLIMRIRRFNPEVKADAWWDEFTVEAEATDRLLDALHYVKWYRDGTLALPLLARVVDESVRVHDRRRANVGVVSPVDRA